MSTAGIADEWAEVAALLDVNLTDTPVAQPITPPAATQGPVSIAADTSLALREFGLRRDLRRLLIVIGAINPDTVAPATGAKATSTDEVIGKIMGLDKDTLRNLISRAGMIQSDRRVDHIAAVIADAGAACDRSDATSVVQWLRSVGAVLRGQD